MMCDDEVGERDSELKLDDDTQTTPTLQTAPRHGNEMDSKLQELHIYMYIGLARQLCPLRISGSDRECRYQCQFKSNQNLLTWPQPNQVSVMVQ
jgi:hypothetical protein